jgi:cell division protein FtsL
VTQQRPHREPDPRARRSAAALLLCSIVLVALALGAVALRIEQVHLAYRLDALRAERARTDVLIRQLEVELATLRSPGRLEQRARQLGMTAPSLAQVKLAREFAPGGSGVAAARQARSEARLR